MISISPITITDLRSDSVDIFLCTPLALYQIHQELQLQPARPLFPSIRTFNPFSKSSPFQPVNGVASLLFSAPMLFLLVNRARHWLYCLCSDHVVKWLDKLPVPFSEGFVHSSTAPASRLCQTLVDWLGYGVPNKAPPDALTTPASHRFRMKWLPRHLACHAISVRLTDILMLPLEGFLLRTLALRFLATGPTPNQSGHTFWFKRDIYPVFPCISVVMSTTGRKELSALIGKIGLCLGLHFAANLAMVVFQLRAADWTGRRWCGSGTPRQTPVIEELEE